MAREPAINPSRIQEPSPVKVKLSQRVSCPHERRVSLKEDGGGSAEKSKALEWQRTVDASDRRTVA